MNHVFGQHENGDKNICEELNYIKPILAIDDTFLFKVIQLSRKAQSNLFKRHG